MNKPTAAFHFDAADKSAADLATEVTGTQQEPAVTGFEQLLREYDAVNRAK